MNIYHYILFSMAGLIGLIFVIRLIHGIKKNNRKQLAYDVFDDWYNTIIMHNDIKGN